MREHGRVKRKKVMRRPKIKILLKIPEKVDISKNYASKITKQFQFLNPKNGKKNDS